MIMTKSVKPMKLFPAVKKIMFIAKWGKFCSINPSRAEAKQNLDYMILVDRGL